MYRILEENGEVRERRDQLRHPQYQKPELLATGANQVWSWDITKLLGPVKWTYFYLYVILDIYSRYVVGWMVAARESAELAKRRMGDTSGKQNIAPEQLTIHADGETSETVHCGRAEAVIEERQRVLSAAYEQRPERFVRHHPRAPELPGAVWINPPVKKAAAKGGEEV